MSSTVPTLHRDSCITSGDLKDEQEDFLNDGTCSQLNKHAYSSFTETAFLEERKLGSGSLKKAFFF